MVAGTRFDEPVMTFTEAAGWLERRFGRRPNVATIWRWATKGLRGVRLATIALGRFRYTTESALERFLTEASQVEAAQVRASSSREGTEAAGTASSFTKAEVAAATRRRDQEKAKALQYLRSRLGKGRPNSLASTGQHPKELQG